MSLHTYRWTGLVALVLVFLLAVPLLAAAVPRYETSAYYSVVKDAPFAPYTDAKVLQRTSLVAYYSVVKDAPFAPYTDEQVLQRTSLIPYFSVVH